MRVPRELSFASVILLVGLIAVACERETHVEYMPASDMDPDQGSTPISLEVSFSEEDVRELTKLAEEGDANAAGLLAGHFYSLRDYKSYRKWSEYAGERGNCAAIGNYIIYLEQSPADKASAAKWRRKYDELKCSSKPADFRVRG
jgi:hypothetical protein